MKKITLLAAMAAVAVSASAQYNTDKLSTAEFLGDQKGYFDYIILDSNKEAILVADKGYTLQYVGPNDAGRNLYIWSNGETFIAGENTMPGVDGGSDYMSLNQNATEAWCGAGYNIGLGEPANFAHFTDETRFHVAYACTSGSISAMYFTILNGDSDKDNNIERKGAQVSLGKSVENSPVVGLAPTDEWQAIEITLGDLRKEVPDFRMDKPESWTGNVLAFGNAVADGWGAGANISLDAAYFFTPGEPSGIESIESNAAQLVVGNRTISCTGANGIAIYGLNGQLVKSAAGSVMGLDNLSAGIYVAKAGNSVAKVVVK